MHLKAFFRYNPRFSMSYQSVERNRFYRIVAISFEPEVKRGEPCLNYTL